MNDELREMTEKIEVLVREPGDLYKAGLEELIAKFGSREDIPPAERVENEKMTEGYNRAAEVLAEVAQLAFDYAVSQVEPSGFQASWAALDFVRRVQRIEGPFSLVRADDYLYPQYDGKVKDWLEGEGVRDYLRDQAQAKITAASTSPRNPSRGVLERWSLLAVHPDEWEAKP